MTMPCLPTMTTNFDVHLQHITLKHPHANPCTTFSVYIFGGQVDMVTQKSRVQISVSKMLLPLLLFHYKIDQQRTTKCCLLSFSVALQNRNVVNVHLGIIHIGLSKPSWHFCPDQQHQFSHQVGEPSCCVLLMGTLHT